MKLLLSLVGGLAGWLMRRRVAPHEHEAIPNHRPARCWCWAPMEDLETV